MASEAKDFTAVRAVASKDFEQCSASVSGYRIYENVFKRLLDIGFVLLVAPIALPIIALFSLLVSRDGTSPFYKQRRIGRNGDVFNMIKIRTMVPGAKGKLEAYLAKNAQARSEWDRTQKLKDDPRITPIGRFLRKSSMDELPQLWNVLRGDMSIVGPRPIMEDQRDLYPGRAYFELRPGITGAWQVSDRNATSFVARAQFDTDYHNSLSFKTDFAILARTVSVVLRCTGY